MEGKVCTASKRTLAYNHDVYKRVIVPELETQVNHGEKFADLRRIYLSRVAAEWIRQHDTSGATAFSDVINSGQVSRWPSRTRWNYRKVYNRYVNFFKSVQYNFKRTFGHGSMRGATLANHGKGKRGFLISTHGAVNR